MIKRLSSISSKWFAMAIIVIGTFMAILDSSIVNIAIPKMMTIFNADTDQIEWVMTAYMLTMAVVIPLTGYLGDRFGFKNMYIFALTVFTIGSFLCGISWDLTSMIFARVVQAIGGGMIMPIGMTLIYKIVPRPKIGLAMGVWGIAAMAAPAIGPTLGGYILEYANWQLIFNVNVPIGIVGIAACVLLLEEHPEQGAMHLDFWGTITIVVGLLTLLLALNNGNKDGWSDNYIVALFITSGISLIVFVLIEINHAEPLLDLRMFANFPFTLSLVINGITTIALFGGIFLIPIFLQNLLGLSAIQTGLVLMPSSLSTAVTMPISGRLFDKYGPKPLIISGMAILVLTTFELSKLTLATSLTSIVLIFMLRGVGLGLVMMTTQTFGMAQIPNAKIGRASALYGTFRQVTATFGIALLSTLFTHQQSIHTHNFTENINLNTAVGYELQVQSSQQANVQGFGIAGGKNIVGVVLRKTIATESAVQSIGDTFLFSTYMALLGLFCTFLVKNTQPSHRDVVSP